MLHQGFHIMFILRADNFLIHFFLKKSERYGILKVGKFNILQIVVQG
jgi:hypothetical protein